MTLTNTTTLETKSSEIKPSPDERTPSTPRLIAFFLPQFHPIPENDAWWGKGFTEWRNVARSRPLFDGHYQPHLPADLGFYDLRVPEVREQQAELAREYGIYGFCYYHYWFTGQQLLERPVNDILASGKPDFPFCVCWANENWTRAWDGQERQLLMEQHYSDEDDLNHIRSLAETLSDPRYIRVEGKPLLMIYRSSRMPDPRRTTDIWRNEAIRLGIGDLFLCRVESFAEAGDPISLGFDAAVEFTTARFAYNNLPQLRVAPRPLNRWEYAAWRLKLYSLHWAWRLNLYRPGPEMRCGVFDYGTAVEKMMAQPWPEYRRFPCVMPGWDNTARRGHEGTVLHNSTPELYGRWLEQVLQRQQQSSESEKIVFINAWNEWAEGAHLEPDQKFGHQYLEATRKALLTVAGR